MIGVTGCFSSSIVTSSQAYPSRPFGAEPRPGAAGDCTTQSLPFFGSHVKLRRMIIVGTDLIESYFAMHASQKGIKAARSQYEAWLGIVGRAQWRNPGDVKISYPKASILKAGRAVFNIKGNDYRLIAAIQYSAGVLAIRFFGTHSEYDRINAETV